ncbi:hypothetical protein BD413DRAFT_265542 [Trametes elegans]|nr:hypothetical protein BD413DRAFT_265542 [Trametes elegans]
MQARAITDCVAFFPCWICRTTNSEFGRHLMTMRPKSSFDLHWMSMPVDERPESFEILGMHGSVAGPPIMALGGKRSRRRCLASRVPRFLGFLAYGNLRSRSEVNTKDTVPTSRVRRRELKIDVRITSRASDLQVRPLRGRAAASPTDRLRRTWRDVVERDSVPSAGRTARQR